MSIRQKRNAAIRKYNDIVTELDFDEVIKYARLQAGLYGNCQTRESLDELLQYLDDRTRKTLDGLLQYLICQSFGVHHNVIQVMPSGPMNTMFQNLILHTDFYARFCKTYAGSFIHYSPIGHDSQIDYSGEFILTLAKLRDYFGEFLNEAWVDLSNEKKLHFAAISFQGSK